MILLFSPPHPYSIAACVCMHLPMTNSSATDSVCRLTCAFRHFNLYRVTAMFHDMFVRIKTTDGTLFGHFGLHFTSEHFTFTVPSISYTFFEATDLPSFKKCKNRNCFQGGPDPGRILSREKFASKQWGQRRRLVCCCWPASHALGRHMLHSGGWARRDRGPEGTWGWLQVLGPSH